MNKNYPISLFGPPLAISGPPLPSNSRANPRAKELWLQRIRRAARARLARRGILIPFDHSRAFALRVRAFVGVSRFPRFDIQNIIGNVANALQDAVYLDDRAIFHISGEKFLVIDSDQRTEMSVDMIGRW